MLYREFDFSKRISVRHGNPSYARPHGTRSISTIAFGHLKAWLGLWLLWEGRASSSTPSSMYFGYLTLHSISRNHTEAGFDAIWNIVLNSEHLFHFSTASRILCQFVFDGSSDESGQFSNQVLIPGGSVRLFKRTLPLGHTAHAESETQLCAALGVSFHSDDVWIIRVAAVSGPLRVDLKAGATRADVLRVPNSGKGTWSDLLPVEASYCQLKPGSDKTVFLVEFI